MFVCPSWRGPAERSSNQRGSIARVRRRAGFRPVSIPVAQPRAGCGKGVAMDLNKAFDDLQRTVNASPEAVKEARRRRDLFRDAFAAEADVAETVPSGSLARGSQKDPIHDVDVIIVY